MIIFSDLELIFATIDILSVNWDKLYISHELSKITNINEKAYKVLVSAVISLRTREKTTWQVSQKLFANIRDFKELSLLGVEDLSGLLYPCGFYKRKAKQLLAISQIILNKFKGVVPDNLEELLSLPGVGRKVANLVLTEVFNKEGICVDTHVHRIANIWGWVKTNSADATELALRKDLPINYWKSLNRYLVLFGQNICLP